MTSHSETAGPEDAPVAGPDPPDEAPGGRPWVGRDDVGADGLRRWERDDLARYANTGESGFLDALLEEGSPVARARAARLIEARSRPATPPALPAPDPGFRERASRMLAGLRRRRAAERAGSGPGGGP